MKQPDIFYESDCLSKELREVIDLPLFDNSSRVITSYVACSLSLAHWDAIRTLLRACFLPSALVAHRAQFEAIIRSMWLFHAASDEQISKLTPGLSLESERSAKNMPQVAQMMHALEKSGPKNAYDALARFKDNSWNALNSYAHAGIHPIRRHHDGVPPQLLHDVVRNTNGLAILACMHAVTLSGRQPLQRTILDLAGKRAAIIPSMTNQ